MATMMGVCSCRPRRRASGCLPNNQFTDLKNARFLGDYDGENCTHFCNKQESYVSYCSHPNDITKEAVIPNRTRKCPERDPTNPYP